MGKVIIAVDPGASGGIAIRRHGGGIEVHPMPETEADVVELIGDTLREASLEGDMSVAYVEQVGGFVKGSPAPGSAMFNFGRNVGVIHGVLLAKKVPTIEVRPQAWQKALSVGQSATYGSNWKAHLKGLAQQRFPQLKVTLKTADALLLLEYARQREAATP